MKILLTLPLTIVSVFSLAQTNCPGRVTEVMEWTEKCNGNLAYRPDSTPGSWLCTKSSRSESMILTGYAAGKTIKPRFDSTITCESLEHYTTPTYVILLD